MCDHSVQNRQQLAHTGRQRDLFGFARGTQALIKPFEHWVVPDCDQRTHVQGGPHMGTATPDSAGTTHGPAVPMEGRYPDQRGTALAGQGASRWQVEHERPRTHGTNTRHTPQQLLLLAPDQTGTQRRVQIVVQSRSARPPGNEVVGVTLISFLEHFPCPPQKNIYEHAANIVTDLLMKYRVVPEHLLHLSPNR
jgi:hypothetical protein